MHEGIFIKKGLALTTIMFLFFSMIIPLTVAFNMKQNDFDIPQYTDLYGPGDQPPHLSIENITGGLGLTVEIKNDGSMSLSEIVMNVNVTGGYKINLPVSSYVIPVLHPGETIEKHVKISGIGLGIFDTYPEIMITINAPHAHTTEQGILARIIGPFVIKVGEFLNDPRSFEGYTLFSPMVSTTTFLINNSGEIVHTWESKYIPGKAVYLLEDGNLLRTACPSPNPTFPAGGIGGRVELIDWNGTVLWSFDYSTDTHCLHHDVEMLPNGNILMIAWDYKTAAEAIEAGRNPDLLPMGHLWPDYIIEVEPTGTSGGNIVWEWHVWDHLIQDYDPTKENYGVVEDHPELIDINYGGMLKGDLTHINGIDYNEEFDQILLSVHTYSEIWVIDHSTTTEEAAGHTGGRYGKGGDLLYRWGNPQAYRRGSAKDQKFFGQHDAQWIEEGCPGEGNILVFNNGWGRPDGAYSSVDEIVPPVDSNGTYFLKPGAPYGPKEQFWVYTAENPTDFYSLNIAGAQRLPNGNTLICNGANGIFFEVTLNKKTVWGYTNQFPNLVDNQVFKIRRYAPDYPGLKNLFN